MPTPLFFKTDNMEQELVQQYLERQIIIINYNTNGSK